MKFAKLARVAVFTLVSALAAHAADFEGTLKWSFKAEITDIKMKQQMAEAQQQMADPAKLEQMKAMLENPEMKAMMEQNPQMRSAIEAQIKLAEDAAAGKGGGDMLSAMMPKGMTLQTKGGRSHMQTEGGAMPMEMVGRNAPPEATMIDRQARTFSRVPMDQAKTEAAKVGHKVTKTNATAKILGYTCEQYLVEVTKEGQKMTGVLWATDDIPGLNASALAQARLGGGDDAFMREIDGVPLRMDLTLPQMRLKMETTSVQAGTIPDSVFEIPAGFTEKPFSFGAPAKPVLPKKN